MKNCFQKISFKHFNSETMVRSIPPILFSLFIFLLSTNTFRNQKVLNKNDFNYFNLKNENVEKALAKSKLAVYLSTKVNFHYKKNNFKYNQIEENNLQPNKFDNYSRDLNLAILQRKHLPLFHLREVINYRGRIAMGSQIQNNKNNIEQICKENFIPKLQLIDHPNENIIQEKNLNFNLSCNRLRISHNTNIYIYHTIKKLNFLSALEFTNKNIPTTKQSFSAASTEIRRKYFA